MKRREFGIAALTLVGASSWATTTDSVYNLQIQLTNQLGQIRSLDSLRGHPVIVTMFYTSCQMVCPMIIEAIRSNEAQIPPTDREKLSVLMVSFDPDRDTVAVLKQTAEQRGLEAPHWTLARSDPKSIRRLAAVLGIQYRATGDGDFNHSSALLLLDSEGRIAARTHQLAGSDPKFVSRVRALLGA